MLIHGHLDVVPADPSEWSNHPLSGEIAGGYLWGRGAIDMKNMVAMTLAAARQLKRDGTIPARDLVFAFLADEEAMAIDTNGPEVAVTFADDGTTVIAMVGPGARVLADSGPISAEQTGAWCGPSTPPSRAFAAQLSAALATYPAS